MDSTLEESYSWANARWNYDGVGFPGFSYLADLAQIPEYRRPSEILAKEMTRKWLRIISTGEDEAGDKSDKLRQIEAEFKRLDVQTRFREVAELDGLYGRGQLYIDTGDTDDREELQKPLVRKPGKVKKGGIKGLGVVEPIWTYPNRYNSDDPLRPDYFEPQTWFVMGKEVHCSRLLTIVSRPLPDILKPAYAFAGLSLSQLMRPYVDNWIRTRDSVGDAVSNFSTMVLSSDLQTLVGADGQELLDRAQLYNQVRDNRGLMLVNKDSEELKNVAVPLSGLDHLQAQSQEHMAAVSGIPLIVLLGITPSGLNPSTDGEIRTFYAHIESRQEADFTHAVTVVLELVQLSLFGEIDPDIGFKWEPLWSLDEAALATVRKTDADTDVVLINAGIISPMEARVRLAGEEDGPYTSLDLTEEITPPVQELQEQHGLDPTAPGEPAEREDITPDPSEPRPGSGLPSEARLPH